MDNYIYDYERKKLKELISPSEYNTLRDCKAYLAGGAILSIFSNTEINDLDFYFKDSKSMMNYVLEREGDAIVSLTERSLLLSDGSIKRNVIYFDYFSSAQEIFDSFDFTIVMCAYDFETEKFVFDDRFHRDIIGKKLIYSATNQYPIGTLLRIRKYADKGFNISRREMIKIALKVSFLNISSLSELEDHIQGLYGANLEEEWDKLMGDREFKPDSVIEFLTLFEPSMNFLEGGKFIGRVDYDRFASFDIDDLKEFKEMSIGGAVEKELAFEKFLSMFVTKITMNDIGNGYALCSIFDGASGIYRGDYDSLEIPGVSIEYETSETFSVYKNVYKTSDGVLHSPYYTGYIYKLGTEAIPNNPKQYGSGIYTCSTISGARKKKGNTIIELLVQSKDIIKYADDIVFSKVFVNRIIEDNTTEGDDLDTESPF